MIAEVIAWIVPISLIAVGGWVGRVTLTAPIPADGDSTVVKVAAGSVVVGIILAALLVVGG